MQVAHQIDRRIAVCSTQAHPPIWARTAPASTSLGGMVISMVAVVPAISTGGSVGTIEVFRSSFLCVPELTRRLLPEEWAGKGAARRGSAAALAARPRSLRVRRSGSPARRRAAPRKSLPDTALWPSRAAAGAATVSAAPTATTASPCGLPPVCCLLLLFFVIHVRLAVGVAGRSRVAARRVSRPYGVAARAAPNGASKARSAIAPFLTRLGSSRPMGVSASVVRRQPGMCHAHLPSTGPAQNRGCQRALERRRRPGHRPSARQAVNMYSSLLDTDSLG
jgi:hypothetical protein